MIRFAPHAEKRLNERCISRDWVLRVLGAPDRLAPDASGPGRLRAFGSITEAGGKSFEWCILNAMVTP